MADLAGRVALVIGASRGVGKGVALGLGEAQATVYITGRTVQEGAGVDGLPGTIYQTADEVERLGGRVIPVQCDHRDDAQVAALFRRIISDHGRLDLLVNNVWGGYEHLLLDGQYVDSLPFWEQPIERWDLMFAAGVRAHYVASVLATKSMTEQHRA